MSFIPDALQSASVKRTKGSLALREDCKTPACSEWLVPRSIIVTIANSFRVLLPRQLLRFIKILVCMGWGGGRPVHEKVHRLSGMLQ